MLAPENNDVKVDANQVLQDINLIAAPDKELPRIHRLLRVAPCDLRKGNVMDTTISSGLSTGQGRQYMGKTRGILL